MVEALLIGGMIGVLGEGAKRPSGTPSHGRDFFNQNRILEHLKSIFRELYVVKIQGEELSLKKKLLKEKLQASMQIE